MVTGKWQAGGRTDGETGGQRLLLFFARTATETTTRNKKQKEAGKGNASFVNEISRTNNVKVAHTDTLTHTHIDTHSHRQMPAHSQRAHTLRPSHAAGVCTDAKQLDKRDKQREAATAAAAASTATAASAAAAPKKQKQTMPCAVFGFKARKNETKAKQRA